MLQAYIVTLETGKKADKSFILRRLGDKSPKKAKKDFTTKTLFKAADRKYRKNKRQFEEDCGIILKSKGLAA